MAPKITAHVDLTRKYGHWTPLREERMPGGDRGVICRCECGMEKLIRVTFLVGGRSTQCKSCHMHVLASIGGSAPHPRTPYGPRNNPLYSIWLNMLDRCENQAAAYYHRYGARGITVCERWHDVGCFTEDILREIGPRPDGKYPSGMPFYSLDRIDNEGNYEPGNVKWSTPREQHENSAWVRLPDGRFGRPREGVMPYAVSADRTGNHS